MKEITQKVQENDIIILSGDTGCGKTTQVPQILLNHFGKDKKIVVSQPRRISCLGVAKRVAQELKVKIPELVGRQLRKYKSFSFRVSKHIK